MKAKSIKKNYILNVVRVISGAAVGLITMPYINRVLGVEAVGKVEYVNTIVNYFLLFTALGIPMYGIREISKVRDKPFAKAKTLAELLIILAITSFVGYILLFGVLYNLEYFKVYRAIILIMSSMIFLSNIGAEWYFQGIEDQLYITIRYIGVRLIMVVLMLLYIHSPQDEQFYALCIVLTTCGANVLNLFVFSKILYKQKRGLLRSLNIKRHIRPVLTIFVATISVNIYLQLDYVLIGTLIGDKYVGYYSVANKLVRFIISFITIIGSVMLPRLSFLFQENKDQYSDYLKRSFTLLILISFPFSVYFLVFAEPLIRIIAGNQFYPAILTMRIISPLCIIVSIAYFMGFLILYPQNKEKIYTQAVLCSAIFSIVVNFFAIKNFLHNGAAVVGILSELLAIIIMYIILRKQKSLPKIFDIDFYKILLAAVSMFLFSCIFIYSNGGWMMFTIFTFLSWLIYGLILLMLKENEVYTLFLKIKEYIK
ncbi:flippase [uncultured Chryseobacterium sp.]|uniref:flippase n=1 Tax=uncultured Chryseobacterium sp. TaxID=259322 RepID=UPI00260A3273|nr:flippase [uncultured Chryseobacterium sp.]